MLRADEDDDDDVLRAIEQLTARPHSNTLHPQPLEPGSAQRVPVPALDALMGESSTDDDQLFDDLLAQLASPSPVSAANTIHAGLVVHDRTQPTLLLNHSSGVPTSTSLREFSTMLDFDEDNFDYMPAKSISITSAPPAPIISKTTLSDADFDALLDDDQWDALLGSSMDAPPHSAPAVGNGESQLADSVAADTSVAAGTMLISPFQPSGQTASASTEAIHQHSQVEDHARGAPIPACLPSLLATDADLLGTQISAAWLVSSGL
eukprot:m.242098 g.242098  ORF g.242098 m.242098 type:complete len:264 (-) comp54431_c3_seq41:378-1169(-)